MNFYDEKPSLSSIKAFEELLIGEDSLMHYGKKHYSGRYPEGSGENPYQHCGNISDRIRHLSKDGMTEKEIAEHLGMSIKELRNRRLAANIETRMHEYERCRALRDKGYSFRKIASELGYSNESSVRSILNEQSYILMTKAAKARDILKQETDEKGFIDIGPGVEHHLGLTRTRFDLAVDMLKEQGYHVYIGRREQLTNPGKKTTFTYLAAPDKEHKEIFNPENHHNLDYYRTEDNGDTFTKMKMVYPASLDSKRIKVVYAEEGGKEKDGLVELRRGCPDLSLGDSAYSQVRILVDGTHYIKGMATYRDDMPDGVDVIFNTNKHVGTPLCGSENDKSVLKKIKHDDGDPNNPFGSAIKIGGQSYYKDPVTGEEKLSLINKREDEGGWGSWGDKLPSQFLAKQNQQLIDQQLRISIDNKLDEFNSIKSLDNPVLKKKMLYDFATNCDSDAVSLSAAALPRQKYQVLLPIESLKDNEVFAPNYKDGEQVALIRFPHAGTFEIPILTVNNKNKEGLMRITSHAKDGIGINAKVASQLSGADFDGDTAMVIPIPTDGKYRISHKKGLEGVANFDPEEKFYDKPGIKHLEKDTVQKEMGVVSNLIMDMTLGGATDEELARAVKHSMVVIDAVKHRYDYKLSEEVHNIAELKDKYQRNLDPETGKVKHGASTLITRAGSDASRLKTQGSPIINPETGELEYKLSDNLTYVDKKGRTVYRTQKSTQMAETKDAYTLSTGTAQENAYAEYANKLKSLANEARLEYLATKPTPHSASARKEYAAEVKHLDEMVIKAQMNSPRERQAQAMADAYVRSLIKEAGGKDNIDKKKLKKMKDTALRNARIESGATRYKIEFTDREWEAIQKGAVFAKTQEILFRYADADKLRERATPREKRTLSANQISRIQSLINRGYTNAEVAEAMSISVSSVQKYAGGGNK